MKILAITLVLVFTCQAFTTSYTLPDLGVNQEAATCQNAAQLLTVAESDLTRLNQLLQTISDSEAILDQFATQAAQICDPNSNLQTLNLLQTNKGKLKKSMSSKVRKLQELQEKLTEDPTINALVGSDISTIVAQIASVASQAATGQINQPCGTLQSSIEELQNFLEWASNEINSAWINGYFPTRMADLNTKKNQVWTCSDTYISRSAATITYSGYWAQKTDLSGIMNPDLTVSGNWNSGNYPTQWIQFSFAQSTFVESIRLKVAISPNCDVTANIQGDVGLSTASTIKTLNQFMSAGQLIDVPVNKSIKNLRITTTKSQSWVAWGRVIFITGETCSCV